MAEPHQNRGPFQIQVSYSFDRLLEPKLARAYEILVPCREHPDHTNDRAAFLRLAETLTAFRSTAETLSVIERQKIVRLLVKDVLVGEDTITIRHSIPIPSGPPQNGGSEDPNGQNYLLCKQRELTVARGTFTCTTFSTFGYSTGGSIGPPGKL
jgi:hypothetical protein